MTGAPHGSVPARILIVDDNNFGLSARKSLMQELGHRVTTAVCPKAALELCTRETFDIIVTDYRMPAMDGTEFIAQLRKQGVRVPVVMVSGFTDTLGLNEANTGADVVIQKSAHEVMHLIRSINRILRKKPAKKAAGKATGLGKKEETGA